MLKSMTAYGRAGSTFPEGHFVVEIQCLNRKHLEVFVQLPRELGFLEPDIRQWITSRVHRGKVALKILATYEEQVPLTVVPNIPLAKQLKSAWDKIGRELNLKIEPDDMIELLAKEEGILSYSGDFNEEAYREALRKVVGQGLNALVEMKLKEGDAILKDFIGRLNHLKIRLDQVKSLGADSTNRYREKLKKSIEEILPGVIGNDDRILREIVMYADKVDITEEITRLESHFSQFNQILKSKNEAIGKTLEFLLQEMHREVNTIGSKTDKIEITSIVVEMKTELEKIREQVQNVE